MEEKKEKRRQFNFDVNHELHKYIKCDAALRGISMSMWIEAVLVKEMERMKKYE
jgi:predicted HicB family RNase H-like nuclease